MEIDGECSTSAAAAAVVPVETVSTLLICRPDVCARDTGEQLRRSPEVASRPGHVPEAERASVDKAAGRTGMRVSHAAVLFVWRQR